MKKILAFPVTEVNNKLGLWKSLFRIFEFVSIEDFSFQDAYRLDLFFSLILLNQIFDYRWDLVNRLIVLNVDFLRMSVSETTTMENKSRTTKVGTALSD